ncbi:hypothetical protein [Lysinibacillus piscis]|uniref:Translation initiation factor 2 n=1 Tax=Lysinibacillus piscis TaxID=2518931 RepID=A0ABQ5NI57_9BACI|nr:hypothetical protein [Lysinibacillus sp. KH24]GLC87992.1 hypothetical protein LYSBPC_11190 [Lysinibacillus sp. KH24]
MTKKKGEELTAAKIEVISSIVLTLGYSLSTLAAILAFQEAEEVEQDQNVYLKQMAKQLETMNNRLSTIEKQLRKP